MALTATIISSLTSRRAKKFGNSILRTFSHKVYSFTPEGKTVISGGHFGELTAYAHGRKVGNFIGHDGDVFAVAPSPDGKYLVSGSADQTVRLWNLMTRELLASLFQGMDGEWVMWTPQGYYPAPAQAASLSAGRSIMARSTKPNTSPPPSSASR